MRFSSLLSPGSCRPCTLQPRHQGPLRCSAQSLQRGLPHAVHRGQQPHLKPTEEAADELPVKASTDFWSASKVAALAQLAQWPSLPQWPSMASEAKQPTAGTDITPCLDAVVSLRELQHIRKLSNLCGLSYRTEKVTESGLQRRHNLRLVLASWSPSYSPALYDSQSAASSMAEGDGMAASVQEVRQRIPPPNEEILEAKQHILALQQATVAAKLTEAAMAATAAATALAGFAVSKFTGSSSNDGASSTNSSSGGGSSDGSSSSSGASSSSNTNSNSGSSIGNGRPAATTTLPPTTTLAAARLLSSAAAQPAYSCPSEWFVCDDPKEQLRIFVIQGSNSLDHWKLNLAFDPVLFEDPVLGVMVHRGVYEAAAVLYDKLLPLVYEHLDSTPFARVTFTGHSIGGCMAMPLMLMFKKRGVLKSNNIAPVYTFGSPSVFCAGLDDRDISCDWGDAEASQESPTPACECSADGPGCLLSALGLEDSAVRHVIMHRDIVPRAFTCDVRGFADILRNWGPSFRSLEGTGRKHLYSVCGTVLVLQPAQQHAFVSNNPDHPLLPPGPGLYLLKEPHTSPSSSSPSSAVSPAPSPAPPGEAAEMQPPSVRVASSAREALLELMDNPHPLEMLTDPAAYMEHGQISRFHNPDHLTQALGQLIHLTRKERRQHDGQRRSSKLLDA